MDVDAFEKGKGKRKHGKGKGKDGKAKGKGKDSSNQAAPECWNCGKKGHYARDCWSKPKTNEKGAKGAQHPKGGRGKGGKGKAKDAHSLGEESAAQEPEVEAGAFDLCKLELNLVDMYDSDWVRIGVDTGAGKTAWPADAGYGEEIPGGNGPAFRTATGEIVQSGPHVCVEGRDEWGTNIRMRGVKAPVCKPLLSVGECTTMGGATVMYGDKGYMFSKDSSVAKKIDGWIQEELERTQYQGCTVAYKENNVYNIYEKPKDKVKDACPLEEPPSSSGGCRRGTNP